MNPAQLIRATEDSSGITWSPTLSTTRRPLIKKSAVALGSSETIARHLYSFSVASQIQSAIATVNDKRDNGIDPIQQHFELPVGFKFFVIFTNFTQGLSP